MAIQILGVYEQVTGCQPKSIQHWIQHITGAAAVIQLRGNKQSNTPASLRMLASVTWNLLIRCVYGGIRLPPHLRLLMDNALLKSGTPSTALGTLEVMILFSDFRADIEEGLLRDPMDIISRATKLDNMLVGYLNNVSADWAYTIISTDLESDIIFDGTYHVYHSCWLAHMWNALRTQRIMIAQHIREGLLAAMSCTPPLFTRESFDIQYEIVIETLHGLEKDILSTVPQHIGVGDPPRSRPRGSESNPIPTSNGIWLMWPLWLVGVVGATPNSMRKFVSRTLHSIGDNQGIQQAHIFAKLVEDHSNIDGWSVRESLKLKTVVPKPTYDKKMIEAGRPPE